MRRTLDGRQAGNEASAAQGVAIFSLMKCHATGDFMIDQWVLETIRACVVAAEKLSQDSVQHLLTLIEDRYVSSWDQDRSVWEQFQNDTSRRLPDGWNLICDYASHRPILLFCEEDRFIGYQFKSGEDLRIVLRECPGFEFYATNENVEYVLCHNHHDYLIGVGACASWISTLNDEGEANPGGIGVGGECH